MKKLLIIAGVILLFLLILGAILWKILVPASGSNVSHTSPVEPVTTSDLPYPSNSPMTFIASCLEQYAAARSAGDDRIPTQLYLDNNFTCFSADFQNTWSTISEDTELDPVLITDHVEPIGDISDRVVANGSEAAHGQYLVRLGGNNVARTLLVTLISQGTGIKINAIDLARTSD